MFTSKPSARVAYVEICERHPGKWCRAARMRTPNGDTGRVCALCKRRLSITPLTVHHLIPRTRHRNKRTRRTFTKEEVKTRIAMLCRPCHDQVHALISEKELERSYNTVEALAAHPDVAAFAAWIADKPDGFKARVRKRSDR